MAVTQYIGARYVPIFADPIQWSNTKQYEPLTIVLHEGNSYTSKQSVPVGVDINNETYWAETGNYNAQIETYRREVLAIAEILPDNAFSNENTVMAYLSNKGYIFDNVNSMEASQLLNVGDVCRTVGYSNIHDDGGAEYVIVPDTGQTVDNGKYIRVGNNIAECISKNVPYNKYIVKDNTAYIYNPDQNLSTLLQTLTNEYDIVYVPSGTFIINNTINIPDSHSIIMQGDYNDSSIAPTVITTNNNVTLFTLTNGSVFIGGLFQLENTSNTVVFKLNCSETGISRPIIAKSKIIGGRESDHNFTQQGVYVECDNVNITEHGYLVYAQFDCWIESVFCALHFHRQHAAATSSGVWLTNNYFGGYYKHCTRYIWNDFAAKGYGNNQCVYNAVIQAGSVLTGEDNLPGINVYGDNSRFNGQMWDFGGSHQGPGIYFESGSTQNFVFVNTPCDGAVANNATYARQMRNAYHTQYTVTAGEKVTDCNVGAIRMGMFMAIWGHLKLPTGLNSGDVICTISGGRIQAQSYGSLIRGGSTIGNFAISTASSPVITAAENIASANTWVYFNIVVPIYDFAQID